ncbi:hypothetical protein R5R35_013725 [Gryllus longicercus]
MGVMDKSADDDLRCGLGSWHPPWLQRLLSKKTYMLAYGVTGMCYFTLSSYFTATVNTMEKQFKISSRTSGIISGAWDMGSLVSVLFIGYFGVKGNKMRIIGVGSLLVATSCFIRLLPHALYGPGSDVLELTYEHWTGDSLLNITNVSNLGLPVCGSPELSTDCTEATSTVSVPAIIMYVAQFIQGIGCSVYWTLGLTYLDDNITKDKAPLAHATTQCIRLLGPTLGFTFAAYTLSKFVDPTLTPRIDNTDPRWIGAWWLGWAPLGGVVVFLSWIMLLFPRQLPRTASRRAERLKQSIVIPPATSKNFFLAIRHLLSNRILVYNSFSAVFFIFGNVGYWIFMPKYMETMYQQTSSRASLISGAIGLTSAGLGLIASGVVMTRYKPRPRLVASWNVIVEVLDALCKFGWIFLDCGDRHLQGSWGENNTWNLTAQCNSHCECGPDVKFSPVCSLERDASFYSPCHAGCNSTMQFANGTRLFNNCSCIPSGIATDGPCTVDCATNFTIFLVSQCIISFLGASGKAGNILIQIRCVHEDDKPLAIAFSEFLVCALAFIPAPIVFGLVLDSACLVWGETCGSSGNCWLYDDQKLRYLLNLLGSGLMLVGVILDIGVCYYAKDLQMYDEEEANVKRNSVPFDDPAAVEFLRRNSPRT